MKFLVESCAPWEDLPTDNLKIKEIITVQILSLSENERNLLNGPPDDENFHFDLDKVINQARWAMEKDPNLQKLRFNLVPKVISENEFWKNYFYRIYAIKKSYDILDVKPKETNENSQTNENIQTNEIPLQEGTPKIENKIEEPKVIPQEVTTAPENNNVTTNQPSQPKTEITETKKDKLSIEEELLRAIEDEDSE